MIGQRQNGAVVDGVNGQPLRERDVQTTVLLEIKCVRIERFHGVSEVCVAIDVKTYAIWICRIPTASQRRPSTGFNWQPRGLSPFQSLVQWSDLSALRG